MAPKAQKKKLSTFVVDCSKPVEDKIMEIASFETFLAERIKVGGKAGALGDVVNVTHDKTKVTVTSDAPMSKRYLKAGKGGATAGHRTGRRASGPICSATHVVSDRRIQPSFLGSVGQRYAVVVVLDPRFLRHIASSYDGASII